MQSSEIIGCLCSLQTVLTLGKLVSNVDTSGWLSSPCNIYPWLLFSVLELKEINVSLPHSRKNFKKCWKKLLTLQRLFCPTYIQVLHSSTNGILRRDLILTILSFPICKDGVNIYHSVSVFLNFSQQYLKFFQWTDFTYIAKFVLILWIWCFFFQIL